MFSQTPPSIQMNMYMWSYGFLVSYVAPCQKELFSSAQLSSNVFHVMYTQSAAALMERASHNMQTPTAQCRFHIMGGECNYLLRVSRDSQKRLELVPDEQWKSLAMMAWTEEAIQGMLSSAEGVLRETAHRLRVPVTVSGCPVCSLPRHSARPRIASALTGPVTACMTGQSV